MDQRRRVDQLDRDRGAQHAVVVGLDPLAGREEDEQRPQPLAAGPDRRARVAGEQLAVRGRQHLEPLLQPRHQGRDVRAARLDEGEDLLRAAHRTIPAWMAMIPPAVRIQRTSVSPAAASFPPSASGPGKRLTLLGRYA